MNLFDTLSVSASGMAAQRQRATALVENLANAETTRTPEGGPYRRKDVVFQSEPAGSPFSGIFQNELDQTGIGVSVSEVVEDTSEPDRRYLPGHPDADARGYVAFPRINPAEDMVDLMGASRNYAANVSAMSAIKDMINRSIDLVRG
ncbi:MAG: flagellar basal body rod protein FlgC [Bryobacteraceae bacterium]|nr:flagellar basal body rod protein FlgC [Bryobacteraceae bacterium]